MNTILPFDTRDNFTKFHNYTLDYIMPSLPPNAWKVLCFIIRKTKGWGKDTEQLSYSLIRQGTGIKSDETMRAALKELIDREYVIVGHGGQFDANAYSLNTEFKATASTTEIVAVPTTEIVAVPTTEIVENKRKVFKEKKKEENHVATQRTTATPPSPSWKEIKKGWEQWKEEKEPGAILNHAEVTAACKALANKGWTLDQVVQCANILAADPFFGKDSVNLWTVAKQIGAKVRRSTIPNPAAAAVQDAFVLDFDAIFGDNRHVNTH